MSAAQRDLYRALAAFDWDAGRIEVNDMTAHRARGDGSIILAVAPPASRGPPPRRPELLLLEQH